MLKSHYCGELRAEHAGQAVMLAGWVHRRRDHGGLIFLDLRDRSGLVQVVFDPQSRRGGPRRRRRSCAASTWCRSRAPSRSARPGTENPNLPTGEIEVPRRRGSSCSNALEDAALLHQRGLDGRRGRLRLRYRYLDLRRERHARRTSSCAHRVVTHDPRLPRRARASSRSRRRSSPSRRRRARATTSCRAACTPARSTPCRSRRSCSSSC